MKTILITGSTDGIGKLAAAKFADDGHAVYLHGRNAEKLASVIDELKQQTGNQNIDGFVADFSDLDAVKQMATQVSKALPTIDVLINNAGIYKSSAATKHGLDIRFVVNYFAPYQLTKSLLPALKNSTRARLINLSSAAAQVPDLLSLSALSGSETLEEYPAYAQSKLALTMWSFYLAKTQANINTIALNPGSLLNTRMVSKGFGQHWSSAEKGANIIYDLASSDKYKNDTGKYFNNDLSGKADDAVGDFDQAHIQAYDQAAIESLITKTEQILKTPL